jgi:NAD-dependent deacetylase
VRVVALTGAGVSAESGLATFRGAGGLWRNHDAMQLATPRAFGDDPQTVQEFYNCRRRNLLEAAPNAAHFALARLETGLAARGDELILVTQNVDDLHERAGGRRVLHMHGELLKARCTSCQAVFDWKGDLGLTDPCPSCGQHTRLRPHVIWFGESPLYRSEVESALAVAHLFVAIGTSGSVYPAAGFVSEARSWGVRCCELNLEPSDNAHLFDDRCYGTASQIVPAWVDDVLQNHS